ncbi:MAG: PASTA domain-containing protein [FCB group bacterium]|jgi:serine/threonine-protein kinase|nr:PASTA domain-containing protein [FCB group bacterium]
MIRWSFAVAVFVGIMALTGFYVFNQATAAGNLVTVPNIVGMPLSQAVLDLERRGLALGEPERVSSDKPEYEILAQRPPAGSVVRSGRKVSPTISVKDPEITPNLIGKTQEEAVQLAAASGFQVNPRPSRLPNPQPLGTVIGQDPAPGAPSGEKPMISVLVSDGPAVEYFLMPDLVGRQLTEIAGVLTPLGLKGEEQAIDSPEQPLGVVLGQSPAAGTWVQAGMQVTYQVRASAPEQAQATLYSRRFTYQVPFSWSDRSVRLDFIDAKGARHTEERQIRGGDPARLSLDFRYPDEATIEVYIDGKLTRSYYYKANNEPIVREFQ